MALIGFFAIMFPMLDRKFALDNQQQLIKTASQRGVECDVAGFVAAEIKRRELETQTQNISAKTNEIAKNNNLSVDEKRNASSELKKQKQNLILKLEQISNESTKLLLQIPNLIHPQAPIGADESHSKEIKLGKTPKPKFSFKPKDHVELGERLGIFDFKNASAVAGAGFYYLLGDGVRLELALQNFVLEKLTSLGFNPVIVPELVHENVLSGAGYMPRGDESNSYQIEGSDLHLIATSEIPLCGKFANQIIKEELPIKLAGLSHCFRAERAAGRINRGLFRVHQFSKVEMLVIAHPEQSEKIHQQILEIECSIFDDLEIPYRVIDVASGDLGAPAFRKYDIEAWLAARNEYAEITSASNCTDYQARRLKIRFQQNKENIHPHILNGTAIAVGRTMIALLEAHQQENGTIKVPKVLKPFLGKDLIK